MCDINTLDDFERKLVDIKSRSIFLTPLYRGQSKDSYKLIPSLCRCVQDIVELEQIEPAMTDLFKDEIRSNDLSHRIQLSETDYHKYENDWRWLEQMQHYGLPTRLLDWSIDPYVALYFAVERDYDEVGQFWVYRTLPLDWNHEYRDFNLYNNDFSFIINSSFIVEDDYESKIAEQRRAHQSGKFTVQDYARSLMPLEDQDDFKGKLIKLTINPESKKQLLKNLDELKNISNKTMYREANKKISKIVKKIKLDLVK
jgi:hypothetical protein